MTARKQKAKTLPNWLEKRYNILWAQFNESKFDFDAARNALHLGAQDQNENVLVALSELRKAGWLYTESNPSDGRKKLYHLKSRTMMIQESLSVEGENLTRSDIETILKKAADLIRTRVDYKFILILLFLKRVSDKWEIEYENAYIEAINDGLSENQAKVEAKNSVYHDFDLPEEYLWDNIRKEVEKLPEQFSKALKEIAERNPELKDVVDSVDYVQFVSSKENTEILRQLVELFSEKKLHRVEPDILGDAYEWILRYFAPTRAKEGEIYTPREVINLLVNMLDPKPQESVYDPACGSGGMLISAFERILEQYGREDALKLFLFGQEANQKTVALAKMNMYIHDIKDSYLEYGDTFLYPKFKDGGHPKQFDVVIANPPWNQDGYNEEVMKKGEFWKQRFEYGFVPKNSADWAWIQHMLSSANDDTGRIGIVLDTGCLFRSGSEKIIRTRILEKDLIDSVILLPQKLFYNTGSPGVIIIFKKHKSPERIGKVLFINASNEYAQHPDVRKLKVLRKEHISKISAIYRDYKEEPGVSKVVTGREIKENDYNLNVTLYVFPEEVIEEVDLSHQWNELSKINKEMDILEQRISEYLREIGVEK